MPSITNFAQIKAFLAGFENHIKVDKIISGSVKRLEQYIKDTTINNYVVFIEYPGLGLDSSKGIHSNDLKFGISILKPNSNVEKIGYEEEETIMDDIADLFKELAAYCLYKYRDSATPSVKLLAQNIRDIDPVHFQGISESIGYRATMKIKDTTEFTYNPDNYN